MTMPKRFFKVWFGGLLSASPLSRMTKLSKQRHGLDSHRKVSPDTLAPLAMRHSRYLAELPVGQAPGDFDSGFVIDDCGKTRNFSKEGLNTGFYRWLVAAKALLS